jgi:hypothetical protein
MGQAIGEILPLALGVAISPVPIIAVILMLLSPRAGASSTAFLVGWVLGVAVVVTVVTLVVNPATSDDTSKPSVTVSVIKLVLGLAAIALGVKEWRGRPAPGESAKLPSWMAAIDGMTPLRALGLAALLAGVNPKNLTLCLAGGVSIGGAGLTTAETVLTLVVFVVIASSTVAVPVLGYLLARDRMAAPLGRLRDWLTANNAAVMSVLLVVIGTAIVGKGLGGL